MSAPDLPPRLPLNPVADLFGPNDELVMVNVPRRFVFNVAGTLYDVPQGIQSLPTRLLSDAWFRANEVKPYDAGNSN
jgi:hypothetical protein